MIIKFGVFFAIQVKCFAALSHGLIVF